LILGAVFWFTDAFINASYNSPYDRLYTYFAEKLQTTPEIYSRITAIILLLILGVISIISRNRLKKYSQKLKDLVFTDSLTDTINRKPFIELLDKFILQSKRDKQRLALLFIDIEKFKQINDVYGHVTGDWILRETAEKIKRNARGSDFLGRLGGDEFVLCLNNIKSTDAAVRVSEKINKAFTGKIEIEGLLINLTVSIGIAIFPDDGDNAIDLIKSSDIAMYKAKNKMKNTSQLYRKEYAKELVMEQALLKAVENNDFSLHINL
jgi:diguanylate cyclase (GGDEF)-like protein